MCVFGMTSCDNDNMVSEKEITCEDIIKAYEEAGYEIFHKETADQNYNWNCYVKCTAPDSDEYIFFYVFETNEDAVSYAEERDWNILLYLFSELFGDSLWLKTKSYNNIAIEYDQKELYKPFESLL
jgi:hypothetical protein